MLRKLGVQARVNGASNVYISSGISIWLNADEKKPAKKPVASICFTLLIVWNKKTTSRSAYA